jgi:small subunit ribosomal protein S4
MSRVLLPKCKQCRRVGEKLMLKGDRCMSLKCALVRRNYPPGIQGPKKTFGKMSEYASQLQEKQKAKKQYFLTEKQFRLTFDRAKKKERRAGDNLLKLLEKRLDNLVFRAGFASSRRMARQLVSHGHLVVNGRKVNIPSYLVREGDVVGVKAGSKKNKIFQGIKKDVKQKEIASWLHFNLDDLSVKVLHDPIIDDLKGKINTQMIIEFYS